MIEHVDTFKTFIETQFLSSPFMLLGMVLNLAGLALHKWKKFDNDWISPIKVLAGGIIYPFIADPSKIYFTTNNPNFANFIIGCFIGCLAVVVHPFLIRLIAKLEQKSRKYLNGDLDKELGQGSPGDTPKLDQREKEQKDGS